MHDVTAIADSILRIAKKEEKTLTPLKLMKLVYIAYGFYLAMENKKLFNNRIEAWKYGPVIPDLYQATKSHGRNEIPLDQISDEENILDKKTYDFLKEVFKEYGGLSAIVLSSLTHKSDTPWQEVYIEGWNNEIGDEKIRSHYQKIVDNYENIV